MFYNQENIIGQQLVAQLSELSGQSIQQLLTQIPWGHHLHIITKCKSVPEALFYLHNQPIGISEYELTKVFPENFKGNLPTVKRSDHSPKIISTQRLAK